jgi:hypothetical protein
MSLFVAEYDQRERAAIAALANRAVEAFQPAHFNRVGYPSRVHAQPEIGKFAEVMHEGEASSHFEALGGLSEGEWALVARISEQVWALTSEWGHPTLPRASLLRPIHVLRLLKRLYGDARPRIFELGPGTGYLGALLAQPGYPYAAMDITQGFYLYQSLSWERLAPGGVRELATESGFTPDRLADPVPGRPVHVPWWHYARLLPQDTPRFDLVICNRALCEMGPTALAFCLHNARAALAGSGDLPKAFLFDGWGDIKVLTPVDVVRAFLRAGFSPAYLDSTLATGLFTPWTPGTGSCPDPYTNAFHDIPHGQSDPVWSTVRHLFDLGCPNLISEALAPDQTDPVLPHGWAELEAHWRALAGGDDHRNRDERFWDAAFLPAFILDSLPQSRAIALFGAGLYGQQVSHQLRSLQRPACCFLDNNPAKQGPPGGRPGGEVAHGPASRLPDPDHHRLLARDQRSTLRAATEGRAGFPGLAGTAVLNGCNLLLEGGQDRRLRDYDPGVRRIPDSASDEFGAYSSPRTKIMLVVGISCSLERSVRESQLERSDLSRKPFNFMISGISMSRLELRLISTRTLLTRAWPRSREPPAMISGSRPSTSILMWVGASIPAFSTRSSMAAPYMIWVIGFTSSVCQMSWFDSGMACPPAVLSKEL